MAQVPSYYYGDFSETQQQPISGSYPTFNDPFMAAYVSNGPLPNTSAASPYSPNTYHMGFSPSTASPIHYNGQTIFSGQPGSSSLNNPSSPLDEGRVTMFSNISSSSLKSNNQQGNLKAANNNCDKRCPSEELDEHLNELPMESLLHLTHHEGQLINESEAEDIRASGPSNLCLSISQGNEASTSSIYSSTSNNFYLDTERDEDDSGSCISSSTMYSMTSTPDSVVPTQSLTSNYSSTSPIPVSNCMGSPYEPPSFSGDIPPSHPFGRHSNPTTSMNSGNTFINPNTNVADNDNDFLASPNNHIKSPSNQMVDYPPVSPDYQQNMTNLDCGRNFSDLYTPSQKAMLESKNTELHHVKKKTKLLKKGSKSDHGPKHSKKPKVKDIPLNLNNQSSFSNGVVSPGEESLRILDDIDKRLNEIADEDTTDSSENSSMNFPSNNMFNPTKKSVKEPNKKNTPPRKRMRCPRGMSLEVKPCEVCGDNAKNMHFGGLVCDSCKAFFRRSIQSQTNEQFKCEKEGNCVITKSNRRSCQYCRFYKCKRIGMQMDWVMTESGRMSLLKNRLARTRHVQEEKEKDVIYGDLPRGLDHEDAFAINHILNTLHVAFASMPYPKVCIGDSIDALSNIFVFLCKRFGKYFLMITEDTDLCQEDKKLLLKNGIAMSLYINGAHMYDPETRSWPANTTHESVKVPHLTLETLQKLANIPDAFSTIMKFYENYESDLKDHVVAALMYLISFFVAEDPNFVDVHRIQKVQEEYIGYLKRYLIARDGYKSFKGIFVKMMESLGYVKDILKFHTLVDIKPTIDHTDLSLYTTNSITHSISNLIHQIEISLNSNFPPYASVLNDEEKKSVGMFKNDKALSLRKSRDNNSVMSNHPDTIAIFGSTTRTDMLITEPLQNMIEWQERNDNHSSSEVESANNSIAQRDLENRKAETRRTTDGNHDVLTFSNSHVFDGTINGVDKDDDMEGGQEVDVDAVCDILKQLSHTDDVKVFSILKENIPRELLEKFSRSLSEDKP